MGRLCFAPVDVLPMCARFLVDIFFLCGLILLRGDDGVPLMGNGEAERDEWVG